MENNVIAFEQNNIQLLGKIAELARVKNEIESQEKKLKEDLLFAMELAGVTSVDNDKIRISYIPASESVALDTKSLKASDPELYHELETKYNKRTTKKAYIRFKVK